ncbi:MAG: hypothetical protein ACREB5_03880 [Sphingomonadaceae bacterium]
MADVDLHPASTDDPAPALEVRDIVHRLRADGGNPVTRARAWVEQAVPKERRGPGWDRHWRELEAYAEPRGAWPMAARDPAE